MNAWFLEHLFAINLLKITKILSRAKKICHHPKKEVRKTSKPRGKSHKGKVERNESRRVKKRCDSVREQRRKEVKKLQLIQPEKPKENRKCCSYFLGILLWPAPFITATDSSRVTYAVYHPHPINVQLLSQWVMSLRIHEYGESVARENKSSEDSRCCCDRTDPEQIEFS